MKFLAAAVITPVVLALLSLGFIYSGLYNVAASKPHTRLEFWVLSTTMENSVQARAEQAQVPQDFEARVTKEGFRHYRLICETCHGAPGVEPSEIGKGLNPEPPELKEEAEEWSPAELFWIVKHGIKMSGMPAFGKTQSDEALWRVVAFVKKLPQIEPAEYKQIGQKEAAAWKPSDMALRTDQQSISEGRRLYDKHCLRCHSPHSHETIVGPGHKDVLHRPKLPVSNRPATVENVARQLLDPYGTMPSFADLNKEQVEDIVAYLNTL
jgi:mono/diheme cytochrome c family protein